MLFNYKMPSSQDGSISVAKLDAIPNTRQIEENIKSYIQKIQKRFPGESQPGQVLSQLREGQWVSTTAQLGTHPFHEEYASSTSSLFPLSPLSYVSQRHWWFFTACTACLVQSVGAKLWSRKAKTRKRSRRPQEEEELKEDLVGQASWPKAPKKLLLCCCCSCRCCWNPNPNLCIVGFSPTCFLGLEILIWGHLVPHPTPCHVSIWLFVPQMNANNMLEPSVAPRCACVFMWLWNDNEPNLTHHMTAIYWRFCCCFSSISKNETWAIL